ncbi:alpha/beta hydrolase [Streptacidiphilus neutrinimicus]|uniref:alpha/beta hydrolase n=1 Tax=Streptacidiphilus neutrinimicus TaxID=105420 RepID=UPI000A00B437|nr:alpha/beta hydrolase-fold protein [Streptacidiphilus neutrinimicus]
MTQPFTPPQETLPARRRRARRPRRRRALIWTTVVVACLAAVVGVAVPVMKHYEIPPFSQKGQPLSFDTPAPHGGGGGRDGGGDGKVVGGNALTELPTGPEAPWRVEHTLDDGTHIGVITYTGPKSGYTGKVWVWAPKQYSDPKYAQSGFPVMIALPGGPGYNDNYWKDPGLKLEQSITEWSQEGKSLPFLVVMPVLNPGPDVHDHYWDGSDIPGQPKMGTWLMDDVPNLMRQNFRTFKSRDGWGFMGSSSGGFVGLKAVLQYPDRFKAALISGPDIVPDSPFWKGHPKEQAENNPVLLSKQLIARGGPDVYIAFQYGTREGSGEIGAVTGYLKQFGNKGPIHTAVHVIQGGRHNAYTYVPAMGTGLITWFSQHLLGPTPSS